MCLLNEGSGAPILQSLALALIRLTDGHFYRIDDNWERDKLKQLDGDYLEDRGRQFKALMKPITISTRLITENAYGIDLADQFQLESYFDSLKEIRALDHYVITDHCNPDQRHYFDNFVRPFDGRNPEFCLPSGILYEHRNAKEDEKETSTGRSGCRPSSES